MSLFFTVLLLSFLFLFFDLSFQLLLSSKNQAWCAKQILNIQLLTRLTTDSCHSWGPLFLEACAEGYRH